jgi:hypothetical protein
MKHRNWCSLITTWPDRLFLLLVGWDKVPWTAATSGLLYQPQMIGEGDCGAIDGMQIDSGNRSTRRKPAPAPLCLPQIPLYQNRNQTRADAVECQGLTAWAMAQHVSTETYFCSWLQDAPSSGLHWMTTWASPSAGWVLKLHFGNTTKFFTTFTTNLHVDNSPPARAYWILSTPQYSVRFSFNLSLYQRAFRCSEVVFPVHFPSFYYYAWKSCSHHYLILCSKTRDVTYTEC